MPDYPFNYNSPTVVNQKRIEIMKRQQREKENLKYEPTSAVKNTKAALAAMSLAPNPLVSFGSALAGSVYDFGTAAKYYSNNQKEKAKEDFVQGILGLLPTRFLKGYGKKNESIYKNLKAIMAMKVASDAKTITESDLQNY